MTETEANLTVEVLGVCRLYCSQVWDEALNQAGVEASSILRKAENVYYPLPSECLFLLARSGVDTTSKVPEASTDSATNAPVSSNKLAEEAEHSGVMEKEKNITQ